MRTVVLFPHGGRSRGFPAPLSRRRVPHHGRRPCLLPPRRRVRSSTNAPICCCWRASPASIPHRRLPSARSSPSPRSAWRDCRNGMPTSIVRRSLFRGCARRFRTASHAAGRHLPEPRWRTWRGGVLRRRCGAGRTGRRGACRLQPRGRTLRRVARSRCCEALARELALLVGEIGSVSSQDRLPLRRSAGGVGKG